LRFTLARRLGLDARTLLEHDEASFLWKVASFKNLGTATEAELHAIVSYGTSLARVLTAAVPSVALPDLTAGSIRGQLTRSGPITLPDILSLCWAVGIPVVQLGVFPLAAKRMVAMAVKVGDRFAILLAKESRFPAQVAYYLAQRHQLMQALRAWHDRNPRIRERSVGKSRDPEVILESSCTARLRVIALLSVIAVTSSFQPAEAAS
jgi:hypothetical protein